MNKFRVLSDLHIDVNKSYPFSIQDKDIFTVICGDTSGYPDKTISWIKKNCPNGVGISGNHLPYNDYEKPLQELREELANAFPRENAFTYLDCETGTFKKEVDGILFIGSCMYTDMHIKHPTWNQNGSKEINMRASMYHMNDYHYGIKRKQSFLGDDNDLTLEKITAEDYFQWFKNAFNMIEKELNDNEAKKDPLPVVLITHHSLVTDFIGYSPYIEDAYSPRTYNWSSYASDYAYWLKRHPSIKCYCCGHIHDVNKEKRSFYIERPDKSKILVVNNARGYVSYSHDIYFNPNRFVDTNDWKVIEDPEPEDMKKDKKARLDRIIKYTRLFI